jgi:hypothetical protein
MHVPQKVPRMNEKKIFEKKTIVADAEFNFDPVV